MPAKLKEMLDQRHERLRDVFNEWDLDRDGNLDRHEFAVGLTRLGLELGDDDARWSSASSTRMARGASTPPSLRTPCTRRGRRSGSPSSSAARSGTRRRAATRSQRASASCRGRRRRRRPPPSSRVVRPARRSRRPKCRGGDVRRRRSCCELVLEQERVLDPPQIRRYRACRTPRRPPPAVARQRRRRRAPLLGHSLGGAIGRRATLRRVSARALPLNRLSATCRGLASAVGGAKRRHAVARGPTRPGGDAERASARRQSWRGSDRKNAGGADGRAAEARMTRGVAYDSSHAVEVTRASSSGESPTSLSIAV